MEPSLKTAIQSLLPLLRSFTKGPCGIALGGAHAKGVDDLESDLDLYVFARDALPAAGRDTLAVQFSPEITGVRSWGDDGKFVQGGTDFYYRSQKVEVWLREVGYISGIIAECQEGIIRRSYLAWTVMGFFNICTLSDLNKMVLIEDPQGILAEWKAQVRHYPAKLKRQVVEEYFRSAQFWPDNFHYKTAVARCDVIYTTGIVQQVVYNLIQVIFALNEEYFPGEKKLEIALDHLPVKPVEFTRRVENLLAPGAPAGLDLLERQRLELASLVVEIGDLASQSGLGIM